MGLKFCRNCAPRVNNKWKVGRCTLHQNHGVLESIPLKQVYTCPGRQWVWAPPPKPKGTGPPPATWACPTSRSSKPGVGPTARTAVYAFAKTKSQFSGGGPTTRGREPLAQGGGYVLYKYFDASDSPAPSCRGPAASPTHGCTGTTADFPAMQWQQ